jgi:hypothetical protein
MQCITSAVEFFQHWNIIGLWNHVVLQVVTKFQRNLLFSIFRAELSMVKQVRLWLAQSVNQLICLCVKQLLLFMTTVLVILGHPFLQGGRLVHCQKSWSLSSTCVFTKCKILQILNIHIKWNVYFCYIYVIYTRPALCSRLCLTVLPLCYNSSLFTWMV